jgi:phage terminase large subunit-like protein
VVIGVDPPASIGGDACGIIAVGLGLDGKAYVLGDHSVSRQSPGGWARAVALAAEKWGADRVVAEANIGGDMVVSTLRGADVNMPVRKVHASHGKVRRAEPVAVLYERGKVAHVGAFPTLEDELCGYVSGGEYQGPGRSPDHGDACVWALSELMLGKVVGEPRVRGF